MFLSCKKFQSCKKTFNFKRKVQKHIFEQKKTIRDSKNCISFRVKLKYHYTKRIIKASPQKSFEGITNAGLFQKSKKSQKPF